MLLLLLLSILLVFILLSMSWILLILLLLLLLLSLSSLFSPRPRFTSEKWDQKACVVWPRGRRCDSAGAVTHLGKLEILCASSAFRLLCCAYGVCGDCGVCWGVRGACIAEWAVLLWLLRGCFSELKNRLFVVFLLSVYGQVDFVLCICVCLFIPLFTPSDISCLYFGVFLFLPLCLPDSLSFYHADEDSCLTNQHFFACRYVRQRFPPLAQGRRWVKGGEKESGREGKRKRGKWGSGR